MNKQAYEHILGLLCKQARTIVDADWNPMNPNFLDIYPELLKIDPARAKAMMTAYEKLHRQAPQQTSTESVQTPVVPKSNLLSIVNSFTKDDYETPTGYGTWGRVVGPNGLLTEAAKGAPSYMETQLQNVEREAKRKGWSKEDYLNAVPKGSKIPLKDTSFNGAALKYNRYSTAVNNANNWLGYADDGAEHKDDQGWNNLVNLLTRRGAMNFDKKHLLTPVNGSTDPDPDIAEWEKLVDSTRYSPNENINKQVRDKLKGAGPHLTQYKFNRNPNYANA